MRDAIEMAREAGAIHIHKQPKEFALVGNDTIKAFEALVRADAIADERDKWMERTAILIRGERKACEDLAEKEAQYSVAAAIRARGETK